MKILLISHALDYTGAPMELLKIATCLKSFGYYVDILSAKEGPLRDKFSNLGLCSLLNIATLKDVVKQYDCVIVNTVVMYTAYKIVKMAHKPVIWFIREPAEDYSDSYEIKKILSTATNVYVCSPYSQKQWLHCNNNIKILKHGIKDCYINSPYIITPVTFALIGSFNDRKGIDIFCDAIGMLSFKEAQSAKFIYLGQRTAQLNLEKMITNSKNRLVYHPLIEDPNMMLNFYRNCSCIVVPSREEPTSRVVIEATMMSIPVIISSHVGAKYLITDRNGFMFPSGNAFMLYKLLKKIIQDPTILYKKKEHLRDSYFKNNTLDKFQSNLLTVVENALWRES